MKTQRTQQFLAEHDVAMLIADKTKPTPDIDSLLRDLGNAAAAIPFYAIYPGDGRPPIVFNDVPLLQEALLQRLELAVKSTSNIAAQEEVRLSPAL